MDEMEKRQYNTEQRRAMAERGEALPDGSFPIADKTDLGNALQSIGRAGNRALALRHIRARARSLDAMEMLPDWAMEKAQISPVDQMVLDRLRPFADASPSDWEILVEEIAKAGSIRNLDGYALTLLEKAKSFGGNRSAAGAYAASVRWSRRGGGGESAGGGSGGSGGGGSSAGASAGAGGGGKPTKAWDSDEEKSRASSLAGKAKSMQVADISDEIVAAHRRTGQKVSPAAAPYLEAMGSLKSIKDRYGMDSGSSILAYALSNLGSFKGAVAKILKGEMRRRLNGGAEEFA